MGQTLPKPALRPFLAADTPVLAAKIAAKTGVSAARNGRSAGFGSVCPIASKHSEQL